MSEEVKALEATEETTPKKLTIADPVAPEVLRSLEQLKNGRNEMATRLLDLEQDKLKVLRTVNAIDAESARIFENILTERGLPLDFLLSVDTKTGVLTPVSQAS